MLRVAMVKSNNLVVSWEGMLLTYPEQTFLIKIYLAPDVVSQQPS